MRQGLLGLAQESIGEVAILNPAVLCRLLLMFMAALATSCIHRNVVVQVVEEHQELVDLSCGLIGRQGLRFWGAIPRGLLALLPSLTGHL